jgi:ABC-type multidrug transport system fused ATPase/permease subunit
MNNNEQEQEQEQTQEIHQQQQQTPQTPQTTCTIDMKFTMIVWGFIQEHKFIFTLYAIFILTLPLKDVLLPHLIGKLYACIRNTTNSSKTTCMTRILLAIVSIIVILQVANGISDFVDHHLYPAIQCYVRVLMMQHHFKTRSQGTGSSGGGDVETSILMTHMIKMPPMFFTILEVIKGQVIPGVITLAACTIYITFMMPLMGAALTAVIAIASITAYALWGRCLKHAYRRDEIHSEIFGKVDDAMSNIDTVVTSNNEQHEFKRLKKDQHEYEYESIAALKCAIVTKYVSVPLTLAFIVFLCWRCYATKVPEDKIVSLLIVCFVIFTTVVSLTEAYKTLMFKWGIANNSLNTFKTCKSKKTDQEDNTNTNTASASGISGISFINVSYAYPNGKVVLDNLNIHMPENKTTVIQGQIGSGKSSILSLLLKLNEPQAGTILFNGQDYQDLDATYVRKHMFLVPQNPRLLNRTVYENIVYGQEQEQGQEQKPKLSPSSIIELIKNLGLYEPFLSKLPNGLDTNVGVGGSRLSGGQRQIVVLIRLFLSNPQVVLLDEPTSSLDESTKQVIMDLIAKAMANRTVIMVTHDTALLEYADHIIYMSAQSAQSRTDAFDTFGGNSAQSRTGDTFGGDTR